MKRKQKLSIGVLQARRDAKLKRLANAKPMIQGSLCKVGTRCGNPNCRCKDPKKPVRHGPYHYLSHRYQNRTQTIFLTEKKLHHAQQWIDNYKHLIQIIYELSEIDFKLLRYHHDKLESTDGKGSGRSKQDQQS